MTGQLQRRNGQSNARGWWTRPQEFDVGLAFNHWKRDGRPERLEFSFPGLIVLYSFLGFNLQDESIFRTSPLTAKKMENSSFPGNRPSRSAWSSRGNRPARSYQRLESISSSISYLSRMLSDGSNFQIEENNNPEEVGTLGHLLVTVSSQWSDLLAGFIVNFSFIRALTYRTVIGKRKQGKVQRNTKTSSWQLTFPFPFVIDF